jgi:LPXTG-motif cell wall anchor domain protein
MSSSINYSTESLNKNKRNNEKNSRENILPKIAVGGGIVLTGVGFLTSKTTLAIIGLGLASVGVIYLYKKKN